MIFEYTKREKEKLNSLLKEHESVLAEQTEYLKTLDPESGEYQRAQTDLNEFTIRRAEDVALFHAAAEKKRFERILKKTPEKIFEDAKKQVDLTKKRIEELAKSNDDNIEITDAHKVIKQSLHLFFEHFENDADFITNLNEYIIESLGISEYIHNDMYINTYTYTQGDQKHINFKSFLSSDKSRAIFSDKVATKLINGNSLITRTQQGIRQSLNVNQAPEKRKQVLTSVSLLYTDDENIKFSEPIGLYDKAVLEAISSLLFFARRDYDIPEIEVSAADIWRFLNNITDIHRRPSVQQENQIHASMQKMINAKMLIDYSQEVSANYIKGHDGSPIKEVYSTGHVIPANQRLEITAKGNKRILYTIKGFSPLYDYCKLKNHLSFYPARILNTTETGSEGKTIELKNYLIQRIESMYGGYASRKRILFETIYAQNGIEAPADRVDRSKYKNENTYKSKINGESKKDRDKIIGILESFKKQKYIKGYKLVQKGKSYIGVDISLMKNRAAAKEV